MGESQWNCRQDDSRIPGTQVFRDGVHFGYYASSDEIPALLLYEKGSGEVAAELPFPACPAPGNFYSMRVKLDAEQYEYNFRDGGQIVTDPYARRIAGREVYGQAPAQTPHSLRGGFLTGSYHWGRDQFPDIPYEEAVMYHLHVRGFTRDPHSGVRHKGTFAGLKQKIPYLKSLGINQVKLMPVYEFSEIEPPPMAPGVPVSLQEAAAHAFDLPPDPHLFRRNYWGYGPGFYFAPKASYAADSREDVEFKNLVRALHENGIEILLEFFFPEDTDIGLIAACLQFWVEEYHADGFSILGRDRLFAELAQLPLFRDRKLICTWYPDEIIKRNTGRNARMLAQSNDGFMNDCRRMLKGDADALAGFSYRIRQHPDGCAQINYITNHDGFTLQDLVSYNRKYNDANGEMGQDGPDCNFSWNCGAEGPTGKRSVQQLRTRQRKNAYAMLLLSQGTPMLLAGDEFGNTQDGNNNPWCQDSELTWLNWNRTKASLELTRFVRELIAFRKAHPCLHQKREPQCADYRSIGFPDLSYHGERAWYGDLRQSTLHMGCMYTGAYAQEEGFLYIAWNFHWKEQSFALPLLPKQHSWVRVMDTSLKESFPEEDGQENLGDARMFSVPPRTVVILEGRKDESVERNKSNHMGKDHGTSADDLGAPEAGEEELLSGGPVLAGSDT